LQRIQVWQSDADNNKSNISCGRDYKLHGFRYQREPDAARICR